MAAGFAEDEVASVGFCIGFRGRQPDDKFGKSDLIIKFFGIIAFSSDYNLYYSRMEHATTGLWHGCMLQAAGSAEAAGDEFILDQEGVQLSGDFDTTS